MIENSVIPHQNTKVTVLRWYWKDVPSRTKPQMYKGMDM